MKYLLIFIASFFSSFIIVNAAEQVTKNGIEVIGKASVKAQPDQFVFTVSINQRGKIASKVKALVDQKSRLIVDKYLSLGIDKNSIESSRLQLIPRYEKKTLTPEFEFHQRLKSHTENGNLSSGAKNAKIVINSNALTNSKINEQAKIYFEVSRTITITFTDFEKYDQLLDNAVKAGATRISPLQTMIIDNEAFYRQALIKALRNAVSKAELIAQQIGMQLGDITHLKESSYHAPRAYMMSREDNTDFNTQVVKKIISAQVVVTFSLK
jgi:uncharacterized protein YggE